MLSNEFVKQFLLDELQKALKKLGKLHGRHKGDHTGLVQVERTKVHHETGTTYTQKYWVKPDQVKKTDVVLHKPNNPPASSVAKTFEKDFRGKKLSVVMHYAAELASMAVVDKQENLDQPMKKIVKKLLQKDLDKVGNDMLRKMTSFAVPDGVHPPDSLNFQANVINFNTDEPEYTIQYVSPFKVDELNEPTKRWLANSFKTLYNTYTTNPVDGKWAIQVTYVNPDSIGDYKDALFQHNYEEMSKMIQQNLNQSPTESNTQPKTDREKEKFGNIIDKLSPSQLRNARTIGICAEDSQSQSFLDRMCVEYIAGIHGGNLDVATSKKMLRASLSEVKEFIKNRTDKLAEALSKYTTGYAEDNEIKTKISTVSKEEFESISQQIAGDWDQNQHGSMKYKIHGIYKVEDMPVEDEFNEWVESNEQYADEDAGGKNCHIDTFYHGTDATATAKILGHSGQFKVGAAKAGRLLGDGVYLADKSSKSAQYINPIGFTRESGRGTLMVCEASLGYCLWDPEVEDISELAELPEEEGCHSMGVTSYTHNPEWCVYDPTAVKPKYLIDLEILPRE